MLNVLTTISMIHTISQSKKKEVNFDYYGKRE